MPPKHCSSASKDPATVGAPSTAAKNAVIFSLVEQVLGKDKKNAKTNLEVTHNAIELYDKHVDALGHTACLEAVKRYLGTQVPVPSSSSTVSAKAASKTGTAKPAVQGIAVPASVKGFSVAGDNENFLENEKSRKQKKKRKLTFGKVINYIINKTRKEFYGKNVDKEDKEAMHKLMFWKVNNISRKKEDGSKRPFVEIVRYITNKNEKDNRWVNTYDANVEAAAKSGRVFFKPHGYYDMDEREKLAARKNTRNWSTSTSKEAYEKLKKAMGKRKMKPMQIDEWDGFSGEQKLQYLMQKDSDGKYTHWVQV